MHRNLSPNSLVHGPSCAAGLNDGSGFIQSEVAYFGFARRRAMPDRALGNKAAADAAPKRDVENRIMFAACSANGFRKSCGVGVIVHAHRHPRDLMHPTADFETSPTLDMVR